MKTRNKIDEPVFQKTIVKEKHVYRYYFLYAFIIMLFIGFNMVFSVAKVSGNSMDSTLHDGQYILLNKHEKVKRFDIVVLKERQKKDGPTKSIVKRVIGFGGDTITVIDGELYINNKRYKEPYLDTENIQRFKNIDWTIKVPKNHVFVMGDNRDISADSRLVGSFKTSAISGVKVFD